MSHLDMSDETMHLEQDLAFALDVITSVYLDSIAWNYR